MLNKKKYCLIFLSILILIAMPLSFAQDSNSTDFDDPIAGDVNQSDYDGTVYVSSTGSDDNVGDAENPTATIKKAIEIASNTSEHKIIINNGTYREYDLYITSQLEISTSGEVIIDGNTGGSQASRILNINTQQDVKISGITFQNSKDGEGGAIYIDKAKVIIDSCKFISNTAVEGGAIYWNANNGILSNCEFSKNRARKSGAAVCWGNTDENSIIQYGDNGLILNVTFDNNDNANTGIGECMGLAIYSDNVKVINSTFTNNNGKYGTVGGSLYISGSNALVENCLFENNTMDQGSAIQCDGDNSTISNSRFINNTINSTNSARGGAIDIHGTNTKIVNSIFLNNGGENCYNGGAVSINYISFDENSIITIENNTFKNNSAIFGASIFINGGAESYCEFKYMIIDNNIFEDSEASTTAGIYVMDVTVAEDENTSTVIIANNKFKNLVANYVSAIFIDYASVRLENNSIINCTSLDENNHIYNNYGYISGNLMIIVNNNDTFELLSGKHVLVNATLFDDVGNGISGGNLTLIVENQCISEDGFLAETGSISIDFYSTEDGIYTISADYLNGDKPDVKTSMVISLPYDILIDFEDSEGLFEEKLIIPIEIGVNGEEVDNETVTVSFNNQTFDLAVRNGLAVVYLTLPCENGTYTLSVTYDIKTESRNIIVKNNTVVLSAPDVSAIPHTGNLSVNLKNVYGEALVNESVIVNGTSYTTDENGNVNVPLDLDAGIYSVNVTYEGGKYRPMTVTPTVNVDYVNVTLTAPDIVMTYKDGSTYSVRLTDFNSNPIVNQNMTMTVGDKSYVKKTDENGIAALLIDLAPNSYIVKAGYAGDDIYKSANISSNIQVKSLAKLTGKNLNMYYADQSKYQLRLLGDDGKAAVSKTIKITIKGKTYKVKTDKNGYAYLKINLKPASYTAKAAYGNLKVSNKITVKSVLSAKNISKKKAKTVKFQAKLKAKKVLVNKKVKFKINKKTYTVKTNKKGIATVNLKNLKVGKHTIYTYYGNSKIKNVIKIKK